MHITLFGGGGFIGRHLAAELVRRGHSLCIPTRNRERVKQFLILLPDTDVYAYDPNSAGGLKKGVDGADVVVNLVGILNEGGNNLYERAHGEFVRMMVDGCNKSHVGRIVQLSAIGAAPGAPSAYLRSKAKGEQIIKNNDAIPYTIIRPSVVFGNGDNFINRFAGLMRYFPIMPLPGAEAKFQPIYVNDLVTMIAEVIENDYYNHQILHAGGSEVLTLYEIIKTLARVMHKSPRLLPLGSQTSMAFAAIAEKIPFVDIITRDNCYSMRMPSICPGGKNDAAEIVGDLTSLEIGIMEMFKPLHSYGGLRYRSGH